MKIKPDILVESTDINKFIEDLIATPNVSTEKRKKLSIVLIAIIYFRNKQIFEKLTCPINSEIKGDLWEDFCKKGDAEMLKIIFHNLSMVYKNFSEEEFESTYNNVIKLHNTQTLVDAYLFHCGTNYYRDLLAEAVFSTEICKIILKEWILVREICSFEKEILAPVLIEILESTILHQKFLLRKTSKFKSVEFHSKNSLSRNSPKEVAIVNLLIDKIFFQKMYPQNKEIMYLLAKQFYQNYIALNRKDICKCNDIGISFIYQFFIKTKVHINELIFEKLVRQFGVQWAQSQRDDANFNYG